MSMAVPFGQVLQAPRSISVTPGSVPHPGPQYQPVLIPRGGSINVAPAPGAMRGPGGTLTLPVGNGMRAVPGPQLAGKLDLTHGLPDPESIRQQKDGFARDLEEQLRKGVEKLGVAHKEQTESLHANANQEKHRYNLVLDQQVKQQELLLSQQYNEQLMRLQQTAQSQRAELEKQSCGLILEYQQRKVQEEYMAQQVGIQKQCQEAQVRLQEEMVKLGSFSTDAGGSKGGSFAIPQAHLQPKGLVLPPAAAYAAPPAAHAPGPVGGILQYVPPGSFSRSGTPNPQHPGSYAPPPVNFPSFAYQPGSAAGTPRVPSYVPYLPPGDRSASFPQGGQRQPAMVHAMTPRQ